jgi:hypothetical protein
MPPTTRLEPVSRARARELLDLMRRARDDADSALVLTDEGRVTGVVPGDDPEAEHLLGDLDVHA